MPFTPLHMGPAALLKAAVGAQFSLTVFGLSQVLIGCIGLGVVGLAGLAWRYSFRD